MTALITIPATVTEPREWTWTLERYHQAIDMGFLTENDRVELLFGKLIEKRPVGKRHAATVNKISDFFADRYQRKYQFREEKPVTLPDASEPESDYVVAIRKDDYYASGHPTPPDILILIEVSDATLSIDRGSKATAYAMAGIKEYWIVNLKNDKLELHLEPLPEEGIFSSISHYTATETFESPLAGKVQVADLLVEQTDEE